MAGPWYCDDGGDNSTGTSWGTAKTTFAAALALASAGETIYVGHNHAETLATTNTTYAGPTSGAPVLIVSATQGSSPVTYAKATSAQFGTASSGQYQVYMQGQFNIVGCFITCGSKFILGGSGGYGNRLEHCIIEWSTANISYSVESNGSYGKAVFVNTEFRKNWTSGSSTRLFLINNSFQFEFYYCSLNPTSPTNFTGPIFDMNQGSGLVCEGMDFSAFTSAAEIVEDSGVSSQLCRFDGCREPSGVALIDATAEENYRTPFVFTRHDAGTYSLTQERPHAGAVVSSTAYTLNASDGTPYSWLVTTEATCGLNAPYYTPWVSIWVDSTGSKTVKAELTSATTYTDSEMWLESEYHGTASSSETVLATTRNTDILAAGTNLTTTGVGTWSVTDKTEQKIEDTFTVNTKGLIRCRLGVAKASITDLYFDPFITVT